jgi:hypothetical protein
MAVTQDDKAEASHIEAIDSSNTSNQGDQQRYSGEDSANEEIVRHLQTTGEDVGMTFNTFMAAVSM